MTSAARPTFLPAVGGHSLRDTRAGPISLQSAKDLPGHLNLKYRSKEEVTREELKKKLQLKEKEYLEKVRGKKLDTPMLEILDQDASSSSESSEDEDDDESDSEELMRELEKIKRERQEEEERKVQERLEQERKELEERAITGNPLLNDFEVPSTTLGAKRRWDDDVIFKNQGREEEVKKRFINDMLRSDFHRKFMNKYVK
jgi:protein CWC15